MKLLKLLQSQGIGSRKEIELLIKKGRVAVNGTVEKSEKADLDEKSVQIAVNGEPLIYRERIVIALHKPVGYECSHKPQNHQSVFNLLPKELLNRGAEPAGRLDEDTTGLLLFSDDGKLIHQLMSPKKEVIKVYRVTLKYPVTDELTALLRSGVVLHDDPIPVKAILCEKISDLVIDLGITEGKYHQVKRMVAAASNRVEGLHRIQIGSLNLDSLSIEEGTFIYLTEDQIVQLQN